MYRFLNRSILVAVLMNTSAIGTHASDEGLRVRSDTNGASAVHTQALRALDVKRNALQIAERSGDPTAIHAALREQGQAELTLGLYTEFLGTTIRVLQVAKDLQDVNALAQGLRDLSLAYQFNHQPDRALEEARNAVAMVLPTKNETAILSAQAFLIERSIDAGRYDDVPALSENALERARHIADPLWVMRIHMLLAEMRMAQEAYGEALSHLALAEGMIMERGTDVEQQRFLLNMARGQIGMGRTKQAKPLLDKAETLLAALDHVEHRTRLIQARYDIAMAEKRWENALDLMNVLRSRTDSLRKAEVALQMAGLQVRYQLHHEQQDNERLRELNSRHTETISGQRTGHRVLLVLLACMIILAAGLFIAARYSLKMMRRIRMKNSVIRRQSGEIHLKNLQLEQQNRRLADALLSEEEKELTIKEIHHRVKNNLQVVDSLLSIQGGEQIDPAVELMFKEAQGRIRSMALVHEHIYRSGGMMEGTLRNHIAQLARSVLTAYGLHDRVSVQVDSNEPMFQVDTMMPLTLLINELLTNAVKHAFVGRAQGRIRIKVSRSGQGYELLFSDDGVGFGEENYLREGSFGLELVGLLAEQLNGEVRIIRNDGVTFSLNFKPKPTSVRLAS